MFDVNNTTIVCIDVQDKLVNMLQNGEEIKNNAVKIMKAANILNMDTIITEQYPKGLGATVSEIMSIKDFLTVEKTSFSAYKTDEFRNEFDKLKNKNIIIFGIETHICVLQSVIDFLENGYKVYILKDCSASRCNENHQTALDLAKQKGASVITLEIALFELLKTSKHVNFKEIQALIK